MAVTLLGLYLVGIMKTTSAPTTFIPRNPYNTPVASLIVMPVKSCSILGTPGAILGSSTSRSNVIYTGGLPISSYLIE